MEVTMHFSSNRLHLYEALVTTGGLARAMAFMKQSLAYEKLPVSPLITSLL